MAPEPEPTPEVTTYEDVVTGSLTNAEICASYTELLDAYGAVVTKRTKSLKGKTKDPYKAASFVKKNGWVYRDLSVAFNDDWTRAVTDALNSASDGQAGAVESLDDYREASLTACGLDDAYSDIESGVKGIDSRQASVVSAAENRPWYSKGYNPYGTDLAWKWTDESCGYSSGYCWTVRVQTRDGCYGGLYAEINIEKNGTVIGYSNDSLGSLGAGKTAKLEFIHYDRGAGTLTGQLTEIRCY